MTITKHLKELDITEDLIKESVNKFGPELAGIGLAVMVESRSRSKFMNDFIKEVFPKTDLKMMDDVMYWIKKV